MNSLPECDDDDKNANECHDKLTSEANMPQDSQTLTFWFYELVSKMTHMRTDSGIFLIAHGLHA